MNTSKASLWAVVTLSASWALGLGVLGLRTVDAAGSAPGVGLGVALIAAGMFVFSYGVGIRIFPAASRALVWTTEVLLCLIMIAALGVALVASASS